MTFPESLLNPKTIPEKALFLKKSTMHISGTAELVLAGTGGGAGNIAAVLRSEPYQLAGSSRLLGGARMIYSVIEHPCRCGRNRTATPTAWNVRAAPPLPSVPLLPPPPGAEDVYALAAASLSSCGPGTVLFLSSCRRRRRRRRRHRYCYRRHTLLAYPSLLPFGARVHYC